MEIKVFSVFIWQMYNFFLSPLPTTEVGCTSISVSITVGAHATPADANEGGGRRFKEGKSFKLLLPMKAMFINASAL